MGLSVDWTKRFRQLFSLYKIPLVLGSISILCIIVSLFIIVRSTQTQSPITFTLGTASESGQQRSRTIIVDVAGAVVHPGVYSLEEGARVDDAIRAAGGTSSSVSTKLLEVSVNRAARVTDGSKIYIPAKADESTGEKGGSSAKTSHNQSTQQEESTSHNNNSGQTGSTISINNASQEELEALSGIGPVTAVKIINGRPYTNLDQLLVKKVIGETVLNKIKGQLSL